MKSFRLRHFLTAFLGVLCLASPLPSNAQKYAYINSDKVMKSLPDYIQAQQRIDRYVAEWQQEIEAKYQEYETMQTEYQQKSYLLPDNLKKHHEEQIQAKHQEIVALQQQRFGVGGDLDKKKAELLKPVQDRVYAAIERVANQKNYAFVFDRSTTSTVLYANVKFDITTQVLDALGFKGVNTGDNKDGKTDPKAKQPKPSTERAATPPNPKRDAPAKKK